MTTKPLKNSIKRDGLHPKFYNSMKHALSCEDCSHFAPSSGICTIGYVNHWHRKKFQEHEYHLTGKMALCRFIEID
ncbi:MAG: hypothetical protein NZ480_01145 [Bdellovibrionaceae bacterium]|nr:hypothetical protein [Pseudobdellovibrionaceae bacterium]